MTFKTRLFNKSKTVEIPADHAGKSLDDDGAICDVPAVPPEPRGGEHDMNGQG